MDFAFRLRSWPAEYETPTQGRDAYLPAGEPQWLLIMADYFADPVWLRTADGRGNVPLPRYRIASPKHFAGESCEQ